MKAQGTALCRVLLIVFAIGVDLLQAFVCPSEYVCIQTFDSHYKQQRYMELQFPDLERLFKGISPSRIKILEIKSANIQNLDPGKLGNLTNLQFLYIVKCKNLKNIPPKSFSNNKKISILTIKHCGIEEVSPFAFDGIFQNESVKGELDLSGNKLKELPKFRNNALGLKSLHLDQNLIQELRKQSLKNLPNLDYLSLRGNDLRMIGDDAFHGKDELNEFDASDSKKLEYISKNAFKGATMLKKLRLDNTQISEVPSIGLKSLEELHLKGVTSIRDVSDDVINLPKLKKVYVDEERRYLCCAFKHKRNEKLHDSEGVKLNYTKDCRPIALKTTAATTTLTTAATSSPISSSSQSPTKSSTLTSHTGTTTFNPWGFHKRRRALLWFGEWVQSNTTSSTSVKTSHLHFTDGNFGTHTVKHRTAIFECVNSTNASYIIQPLAEVECYPKPDALRPCDDIMGDTALTSLSWIVSFIAVISNGIVFGVLMMSRRQFNVTKFLIINLAFADMCLGLYLFVLTCASIDTTGKYYNSVLSWQYEGGCDVVGFLAVFSSELSMLILTVITIERYFAIVYAVYLQKRLSLRQATILTGMSWGFAFFVAALPLAGVNSYNEVAICLPFKISTTKDVAYLAFVFGFNSLLFGVIVGCYFKIYWAVAGPQSSGRPPAQTNDSSIAKRIAMLVFTDFACWLPIAIVGMIAAAGYSENINMTVEKSKYLLVIFFPINSVCNPFLYALSTRTFRREFLTLLAQCGFCRERLHQYHTNTYTGHSMNRKLENKVRRATETINLSTLSTANGNSITINGTSVSTGVPEKNSCFSPTLAPLCAESPAKNNNNFPITINPANQSDDSNSNNEATEAIGESQVNNFMRFNSSTPLTENLEGATIEEQESVIETHIAF